MIQLRSLLFINIERGGSLLWLLTDISLFVLLVGLWAVQLFFITDQDFGQHCAEGLSSAWLLQLGRNFHILSCRPMHQLCEWNWNLHFRLAVVDHVNTNKLVENLILLAELTNWLSLWVGFLTAHQLIGVHVFENLRYLSFLLWKFVALLARLLRRNTWNILTATVSLGDHELTLVVEEHADLLVLDCSSVDENTAKVETNHKLHQPSHKMNVVRCIECSIFARRWHDYSHHEIDG